jgi:hypothetical protein
MSYLLIIALSMAVELDFFFRELELFFRPLKNFKNKRGRIWVMKTRAFA